MIESQKIGEYLIARHLGNVGKTNVWTVDNTSGQFLGSVKWYSPWRQYCFFIANGLVLNNRCMNDIKNFLDKCNEEHSDVCD